MKNSGKEIDTYHAFLRKKYSKLVGVNNCFIEDVINVEDTIDNKWGHLQKMMKQAILLLDNGNMFVDVNFPNCFRI